MCDTMVALPNTTRDNTMLLAKNSDREANESQVVVYYPRKNYGQGEKVQCTYLEISQVRETYEVVLCKPFWMWGAEMGANEYGVAIGNEAVFTKEPYSKKGLTGMDLLRLALERTQTAQQAMETIINLIQEHGQGGNCGMYKKLYYHNSFIIADPLEAWVLETAGKFWVAEKVKEKRSISNCLTIGSRFDLCHENIMDYAKEKNYCKSEEDFHFARCFSDKLFSHFARGRIRKSRSQQLLEEKNNGITLEDMVEILRDHGLEDDSLFTPDHHYMHRICMHAGGPISSQTTGSLIAQLQPDLSTLWVTGTAAPCTSIFKPVYFGISEFPNTGESPTDKYNPEALWWLHEKIHRQTLHDYASRMDIIKSLRDPFEKDCLQKEKRIYQQYHKMDKSARSEPLTRFTKTCFEQAYDLEHQIIKQMEEQPLKRKTSFWFNRYWKKANKKADWH